jgi:hypothetical protein
MHFKTVFLNVKGSAKEIILRNYTRFLSAKPGNEDLEVQSLTILGKGGSIAKSVGLEETEGGLPSPAFSLSERSVADVSLFRSISPRL